MLKLENHCCDCATESYPCIGKACMYVDVPVYYCDECDDEADYHIDGKDMCEKCANKYLNEEFSSMTVCEKSGLLEVKCERI